MIWFKEEFCLKCIVINISETYQDEGGKSIDFQKIIPECDHIKHTIKQNMHPIYPYLQKMSGEALRICDEFEITLVHKMFEYSSLEHVYCVH